MTGDAANMLMRIKATLPPWFPDVSPVLDALLSGFAATLASLYDFIAYTKLQTRIATATGFWLDLAAYDFFGMRFRRPTGATDDGFRKLIIAEVLRERATRVGMKNALQDLTGVAPKIFEPARIQDTGALGVNIGLGISGGVGSYAMPGETLIKVQRPKGSGIPNVNGYGGNIGGLGVGSEAVSALSDIVGKVTDNDIYNMVQSVKPAGVLCWVAIVDDVNKLPPSSGFLLAPSGSRIADTSGAHIILTQ